MKNIYKALANFQQECPVIHKGTAGYGYSYTDLPEIFKVINPLLKKNGLGFTQLVNGVNLKTIVFHIESGETIESDTEIPQGVSLAKMNEFQVLGSAITYLRRYSLSSILGLVTDKDTDAGGQQKAKKEEPETVWATDKIINHYIDNNQAREALLYYDGKTIREGKKYCISKANKEKLNNALK